MSFLFAHNESFRDVQHLAIGLEHAESRHHHIDVEQMRRTSCCAKAIAIRPSIDKRGPRLAAGTLAHGTGHPGHRSPPYLAAGVSVNYLHGITGLEEFDPALYQRLAKGN